MPKPNAQRASDLLASITEEMLGSDIPSGLHDDGLRVEKLPLELVRPHPVQPRRVLPERIHQAFQQQQLTALGMAYEVPPKVTKNGDHGQVLDVGDLRFEIRHCPGHTLGHIVLVEHNERTVFTGDCLFSGSIGRTDLPGGKYEQLIESIEKNVLSLDDDFTVCCGHGPDTTVGRERESNPFLTGVYGG